MVGSLELLPFLMSLISLSRALMLTMALILEEAKTGSSRPWYFKAFFLC